MTTLVLGSNGQVGSYLKQTLPSATFWTRAEADLNHPATITEALCDAAPTMIVHSAAFTAVDQAEGEPLTAWRVNSEGTAAVAAAAAALDVPLLYLSTDYVFDGKSNAPYPATAAVAPINVYGRTKVAGEMAVRSLCPKHWIIRTSWVFGATGSNFVKTMVRLGRERSELRVVSDQRGRPTYAGDLARLIAEIVRGRGEGLKWGTYHTGGGTDISWHEFATQILTRAHQLGLIAEVPRIEAIPTKDYPTAAERPLVSVMQSSEELDLYAKLDWSGGLEETLEGLRTT